MKTTGDILKEEGIARAAAAKSIELATARDIAYCIASEGDGTCDADRVQSVLIGMAIDLGPAAGAIFKNAIWEFTGDFKKSERDSNHSRIVRIWKLK